VNSRAGTHLAKRYLGPTAQITLEKLEGVARELAASPKQQPDDSRPDILAQALTIPAREEPDTQLWPTN
jgi:hypothetical protein